MRISHKVRQPRKYYFTNFRIQAQTLRVIDDLGKQIGVITKEEALKICQEKDLDLVLRSRAFDVIDKFIKEVGEVNISKPPKLEGRVVRAVIAKKK